MADARRAAPRNAGILSQHSVTFEGGSVRSRMRTGWDLLCFIGRPKSATSM
jgi:hypothetical protein